MLFHDALHLVFTTFSRQVLQQGRLTAYLADCGVFDTFDDRRTICLTIDCHYGDRLFACLSHKPYKATFDTIVQECKQRHPNIDPVIVDYVFQSIRFAWGKIKSVRPPKPPVLFPPVKKKRSSRLSPLASSPKKRPSPKRRPSLQGGAGGRLTPNTLHPTPKKRVKRPIVRRPYIPYTPPVLTRAQRQKRTARVVLYILAIIFAFAAIITYNGGEMLMGTIFFGAMATCLLIIHKLL
jgi:hypothetical protein